MKCCVYLTDANDFPAMNEVYEEFFPSTAPPHTTIQAGMVAKRMRIEIDCIAFQPHLDE